MTYFANLTMALVKTALAALVGAMSIGPTLGYAQAFPNTQQADTAAAKQMFDSLLKQAEAGDAEAQQRIGGMYSSGTGVTKDPMKAADWWKKSASQGNPGGQVGLGYLGYWLGQGVPMDKAKGLALAQKAAAQGLVRAQSALGQMYTEKDSPMSDLVLAYAWTNLAAGSGDQYAALKRTFIEETVAFTGPRGVEREMTQSAIAEAQRLSSTWKKGEILVRKTR